MTDQDSILRLNYWVLGDHPTHKVPIARLPSHHNFLELKELILEKRTDLRDIDANEIHMWRVDIEMEKLKQIREERQIEGMEVLSPQWLTLLSEVFRAQPDPDRIHIIMSHPPRVPGTATGSEQDGLYALRELYKDVWHRPESLVSQETVKYEIEEEKIQKEKTCDVFVLGDHAQRLLLLGFHLGRQLIVTDEYKVALQYIGSRFSREKPSRGFVVTGQPGIGKSLFLLYVLLKRMQQALPVAVHVFSTGYYLVDRHGVSFYRNSTLQTQERIWCLSDSTVDTKVPVSDFLRSASAQIIQAASPQRSRWHEWRKVVGAKLYFMNTWDMGELALLAALRGGQESVSKILRLSFEWGPSPRHLMQALDDSISDWENTMSDAIDVAAEQLAGNPEQVLSSVATLAHESIASPVLWIRARDKVDNRMHFDAYVPNATRIANAVHGALSRRTAVELATYFRKISHNSQSRSLSGYLFESLTHSMITSGSRPFASYILDGSSKMVLPVTSNEVVSGIGELKTAIAPFYYQPGLANYPGIDSALCTRKTVYAIQATVSPKHTSALGGLQKLYDELPPNHRLPKDNWYLLFASPKMEQGLCLAELQRKAILGNLEWKGINIGYFTPLHIEEFAPVMESGEKGKGRAIEEDSETPEQPMEPSTSSAPTRTLRESKRSTMPARSTSPSNATAPAKKKSKAR